MGTSHTIHAGTTTPGITDTPTVPDNNGTEVTTDLGPSGLSPGEIAGVVCGVVGCLLIVLVVVLAVALVQPSHNRQ